MITKIIKFILTLGVVIFLNGCVYKSVSFGLNIEGEKDLKEINKISFNLKLDK